MKALDQLLDERNAVAQQVDKKSGFNPVNSLFNCSRLIPIRLGFSGLSVAKMILISWPRTESTGGAAKGASKIYEGEAVKGELFVRHSDRKTQTGSV